MLVVVRRYDRRDQACYFSAFVRRRQETTWSHGQRFLAGRSQPNRDHKASSPQEM